MSTHETERTMKNNEQTPTKKHFVIIDGLSFLFRAYHAVRPLTRADGLHTNALYGFAQMLIKVVRDLNPDLCCVALDSQTPTFRKELYPDYKAHRTVPDEEMLEQLPYFEPMIKAFGISGLRVNGVEADDIIATLVNEHKNTCKITIVSSDKDLMQLLGGDVFMLDTMKGTTIGAEGVVDKFGVMPDKVIEVQSLIGDSSDNIPGVPSVGPKTAAKLIAEFGSLEEIYQNLDKIPQDKLRQKLSENKENAFLSKKLVTLKKDVHLNGNSIEKALVFSPTADKARTFLIDMEFKTLAARLTDDHMTNGRNLKKPTAVYQAIQNETQFEHWLEKLNKADVIAFDTETTSIKAHEATLVGLSLAVCGYEGCYIPLRHKGDLFDAPQQLNPEKVFKALAPIFADKQKIKVAHNLKYDLQILEKEGLVLNNCHDTMLMSYALHGGEHNHGLDGLAKRYLGVEAIPFKDVCGTGKKQITFDYADILQATDYAAQDADLALRLYQIFWPELQEAEGPLHVYSAIELPIVPVVAAMERRGVEVNKQELITFSADFLSRMDTLKESIFKEAGTEFNLNSPKQMGEVLFEHMNIEGGKKTKTGYTTNEAALTKLAEDGYDIAKNILAYRSLAKLKSTYSDALQNEIAADGRVHTSYHQGGAATGRFSSSDPNLQNIPIRSEDGRKIRHAFVAANNHVLVSADYSQIELRLLAHMADIKSLIEAFKNGADIHSHTAREIFALGKDEEITTEQRSAAKTINFGLVYGMGPYALAQNLGIDNKTAKDYIDTYLGQYQGIKQYMEDTKAFARTHGYVETLFGRRVHVPNINDKNRMLQAGAERAAINAPLQGSNADIIKMAMKQLEDELTGGSAHLGAKMLMQVHDELIFEIPEQNLDEATQKIKEIMENIVEISVPLTVGLGHGRTWEAAH